MEKQFEREARPALKKGTFLSSFNEKEMQFFGPYFSDKDLLQFK